MKIEIIGASHPAYSPNVLADQRKVSAPKHSICDPWGWSEDEIMLLIGESNYRKFENGKNEFTISASHFKLVTGQRAANGISEIKLLAEYGIL